MHNKNQAYLLVNNLGKFAEHSSIVDQVINMVMALGCLLCCGLSIVPVQNIYRVMRIRADWGLHDPGSP